MATLTVSITNIHSIANGGWKRTFLKGEDFSLFVISWKGHIGCLCVLEKGKLMMSMIHPNTSLCTTELVHEVLLCGRNHMNALPTDHQQKMIPRLERWFVYNCIYCSPHYHSLGPKENNSFEMSNYWKQSIFRFTLD